MLHDNYVLNYDLNKSPIFGSASYPIKSAFEVNDDIAGIIEISSDQILTRSITLLSVAKEHYSDATFTSLIEKHDLYDVLASDDDVILPSLIENRASFASFI